MPKLGLGLFFSRKASSSSGPDPDALAYINAVEAADGQALEAGVKTAIIDFVVGCKADGNWGSIVASCILCGARTLAGALVPLRGNAPLNVKFLTGNYDRKAGLTSDGGATGLLTGYNNANTADFGLTNCHMSFFPTMLQADTSGVVLGGPPLSGFNYMSLSYSSAINLNIRIRGSTNQALHQLGFVGASRGFLTSFIRRIGGVSTQLSNSVSGTASSTLLGVFGSQGSSATSLSNLAAIRLAFYSLGKNVNLELLDSRVTSLYEEINSAIPQFGFLASSFNTIRVQSNESSYFRVMTKVEGTSRFEYNLTDGTKERIAYGLDNPGLWGFNIAGATIASSDSSGPLSVPSSGWSGRNLSIIAGFTPDRLSVTGDNLGAGPYFVARTGFEISSLGSRLKLSSGTAPLVTANYVSYVRYSQVQNSGLIMLAPFMELRNNLEEVLFATSASWRLVQFTFNSFTSLFEFSTINTTNVSSDINVVPTGSGWFTFPMTVVAGADGIPGTTNDLTISGFGTSRDGVYTTSDGGLSWNKPSEPQYSLVSPAKFGTSTWSFWDNNSSVSANPTNPAADQNFIPTTGWTNPSITIAAAPAIITSRAFNSSGVQVGSTQTGPIQALWVQENTTVTSVVFANDRSVTSIGNSAFYGCTNLAVARIPFGVTNIGDSTFEGCFALNNITIPSSVTSIGSYAFYGCNIPTSVTIPSSVTSIANYAFGECTSLATILCYVAPSAFLASVGSNALSGTASPLTIRVPASGAVSNAWTAGAQAFQGNSNVTVIKNL
jgi:hypothetical protein